MPLPVLERIQAEMLDYKGTGVSILETSHRAPEYDEAHQSAKARIKRLLNMSDNFEVLFMTGGALDAVRSDGDELLRRQAAGFYRHRRLVDQGH